MCPGACGYVAQKRFIFITFYGRGRRTVCAVETISEWQPGTLPQNFSRQSPFHTPNQPRGAQNILRLHAPAPVPARSFPPSFPPFPKMATKRQFSNPKILRDPVWFHAQFSDQVDLEQLRRLVQEAPAGPSWFGSYGLSCLPPFLG